MRSRVLIIFLIIFLCREAFGAEGSRRIEEEKRSALEETETKVLEKEKRFIFDYGGWINHRFDNYHNDDNDSLTDDAINHTNSFDSRLWLKAILRSPLDNGIQKEHSLYIRLKDYYIHRYPDDNDRDGPHLDYAYLTLDLQPLWFRGGRGYFDLGRGIAFSNVNDGAELFFILPKWKFNLFLSQTLPHEDNIDISVPGYDKESDRKFYGFESTYYLNEESNLYGFFLMQRDFSDEDPEDTTQEYTYDSEYTGIGAEGKIWDKIRYWGEFIMQTGQSYTDGTNEKKDISAWAGNMGVKYETEIYSHPEFSFEYAFGSGDADRSSVTNTQNGNTSGDDNNFLYFGYIETGYALSPLLSNLEFYKARVSFKPLEHCQALKRLSVDVSYYLYRKDEKAGGIYDLDATESDADIGKEIDVRIFWQAFSDLSFEVQYGYFYPGDAYPVTSDDSEEYLAVSTSLAF
ncbi:MAG: alginate export family protein [Candidatus Omnitrophota bacterium]